MPPAVRQNQVAGEYIDLTFDDLDVAVPSDDAAADLLAAKDAEIAQLRAQLAQLQTPVPVAAVVVETPVAVVEEKKTKKINVKALELQPAPPKRTKIIVDPSPLPSVDAYLDLYREQRPVKIKLGVRPLCRLEIVAKYGSATRLKPMCACGSSRRGDKCARCPPDDEDELVFGKPPAVVAAPQAQDQDDEYDESTCVVCGDGGRLIGCDWGCNLWYHAQCAGLLPGFVPDDGWMCPTCHQLPRVCDDCGRFGSPDQGWRKCGCCDNWSCAEHFRIDKRRDGANCKTCRTQGCQACGGRDGAFFRCDNCRGDKHRRVSWWHPACAKAEAGVDGCCPNCLSARQLREIAAREAAQERQLVAQLRAADRRAKTRRR